MCAVRNEYAMIIQVQWYHVSIENDMVSYENGIVCKWYDTVCSYNHVFMCYEEDMVYCQNDAVNAIENYKVMRMTFAM